MLSSRAYLWCLVYLKPSSKRNRFLKSRITGARGWGRSVLQGKKKRDPTAIRHRDTLLEQKHTTYNVLSTR